MQRYIGDKPVDENEYWETLIARGAVSSRPDVDIPGWGGSVGPFPSDYGRPHVYARDVHSGGGNCVCGQALGHTIHVQAAPGVPIPPRLRP